MGDGSLPQGLTVQNTYSELKKGSKNIVVVVRNSTAYPQNLKKKTPVARAVVATMVPDLPVETGQLEELDEPQVPHAPKLTVRQRQGKLFKQLDLSVLVLLPSELADSALSLLAKYHDVISLEQSKLGCIHSTKCIIKVTDDTPFKEECR